MLYTFDISVELAVKKGQLCDNFGHTKADNSAFGCLVLIICGKSIKVGSPVLRCMRMLNSLKSPCMSPL